MSGNVCVSRRGKGLLHHANHWVVQACTSTDKKSDGFKAMVKTEAGLFEKLLAPILVSVGLPPWHYLIMPCSCQLATDTAVRCRC